MQPMLMIAERFPPDLGGVARSAQRTAQQLTKLGWPCDVFCWTKSLPPGQLVSEPYDAAQPSQELAATPENAAGAPLQGSNASRVDESSVPQVHRFGMFANFDFTLQHSLNVIEWLQAKHEYRAIWGHYLFPSGFVAVMLARLLNVSSIVSARGNDVDRLMFPPGDFARLQWTLQHADQVTAVSHDLARKIRAIDSQVDPRVVHNSVDANVFAPQTASDELRRQLQIYPNETVLGFCGELRHKKGLPFLLAALQHVRRDRPACLLVIGTVRTSEWAQIQQCLDGDRQSQQRILVTGPLDSQAEVARHLALCDAVLLPSVWDGLPNAALEAMACQRLVVASDVGGLPEVIQHQQNGVLVPKAQLHRFGEGVLECLGLPAEHRAQLVQAARQRVLDHFSPDQERAALADVMSRCGSS